MNPATPADFHAAPGDPVRPKLDAFVRYVLRDQLAEVTGGPARIQSGATGKRVVVETPAAAFLGAFHVAKVNAREIRVGEGTVNGLRPQIGGVFLDGTRAPEGTVPHSAGVPTLTLYPNIEYQDPRRGRSYVVVRWIGQIDDPEAFVKIDHYGSLARLAEDEQSFDTGWPLAELTWSGDEVTRVRQMAWFDLVLERVGDRWIWGPR